MVPRMSRGTLSTMQEPTFGDKKTDAERRHVASLALLEEVTFYIELEGDEIAGTYLPSHFESFIRPIIFTVYPMFYDVFTK